MSKSILLFGLAGISVLFACKHAVPYPEISNNPIVSLNCSSDTVYFQNEILPILASNCAMSGCHDSQSAQDGIVLTDYVSIMNSDVIERGKPNKSELVEVLTESGEDLMPPSPYNALSSDMISKIEKWISQGAINNQCMECDSTLSSFSMGVWPIVRDNCQGCHSSSTTQNGNHVFNNYQDIVNDSSAFWNSILGNNGYSLMPKNSSGLDDCKIKVIRNWFEAGAPNN
ncbi:MAG: hypothetical protein RL106_411 [Bacteroidota bacterium]|jgi:hypothetical protein